MNDVIESAAAGANWLKVFDVLLLTYGVNGVTPRTFSKSANGVICCKRCDKCVIEINFMNCK